MSAPWQEGDEVPQGFKSDTTVGAAAVAVRHAMIIMTDTGGKVDPEVLARAWTGTIEKNGPENSARLLLATATLASVAYFELAKIKETPPGVLLDSDAELVEAVLRVMSGER